VTPDIELQFKEWGTDAILKLGTAHPHMHLLACIILELKMVLLPLRDICCVNWVRSSWVWGTMHACNGVDSTSGNMVMRQDMYVVWRYIHDTCT